MYEGNNRLFLVLILIIIALVINRFMFKKDLSICSQSNNVDDLGIFARFCQANQ